MPATLKKSTRPLEREGARPPRGDRPPRRFDGEGRGGYRSADKVRSGRGCLFVGGVGLCGCRCGGLRCWCVCGGGHGASCCWARPLLWHSPQGAGARLLPGGSKPDTAVLCALCLLQGGAPGDYRPEFRGGFGRGSAPPQ